MIGGGLRSRGRPTRHPTLRETMIARATRGGAPNTPNQYPNIPSRGRCEENKRKEFCCTIPLSKGMAPRRHPAARKVTPDVFFHRDIDYRGDRGGYSRGGGYRDERESGYRGGASSRSDRDGRSKGDRYHGLSPQTRFFLVLPSRFSEMGHQTWGYGQGKGNAEEGEEGDGATGR